MITVGIPKALLYYKYGTLWINFFNELKINTKVSNKSNKEILEKGIKLAQDEACLSLKLYLGHVNELVGKVDYILVPRIVSLKKHEKLCTNFSLLYDLVQNTFKTKILNYNIDIDKHISEMDAFIKMGECLNRTKDECKKAYIKAKNKVQEELDIMLKKQDFDLKSTAPKILLVAHPYNLYDELIGKPIIEQLKKSNIKVIYSNIYDDIKKEYECSKISNSIYWTYNKDLMGAISHYQKYVDGIILITTFPCGPDSLANEMIIKKVKDLPIISIVIDELNNTSGLFTRLESFIDIVQMKRGIING